MTEVQTFKDYFVCFELRVPRDRGQDAMRTALQENSRNGVLTARRPATRLDGQDGSVQHSNQPASLVVNIRKYWSSGRTLTIKFLGGDAQLREKVKKHATNWLQHANIKFNWLDDSGTKDSDIRISFQLGGGSWSYVGTDCFSIKDQQKATMNFGWLYPSTKDEDVRAVVLHEFGHALGCEHEHQSPLADLDWNEELIYQEMAGYPNFWPREQTKSNIIDRLSADGIMASEFDRASIMLYEYPPTWFRNKDHQGTPRNTKLSNNDIKFIQMAYPPYPTDVGQFSTLEVRQWYDIDKGPDTKQQRFEPPYQKPPRLAIGLTWLDLDAEKDLSVSASAEDIFDDTFTINVQAGPGSRVYSAACSWLEVSTTESEILTGAVDLKIPLAGSTSARTTSTWVQFDSEFTGTEAPDAICWLNSLSMSKDHPWRLKAYITKVGQRRFQLNVETGPDSVIHNVGITWIAFPKDKDGIAGGQVNVDTRSSQGQQLQNITSMSFPTGTFKNPPQVMMAISALDFECGHNLRLKLSASDIKSDGLTWNLDTWLDSEMNGASVSYVAISVPEAAGN